MNDELRMAEWDCDATDRFGSCYVPLAPTCSHILHAAHAEVPRPLFLSVAVPAMEPETYFIPG